MARCSEDCISSIAVSCCARPRASPCCCDREACRAGSGAVRVRGERSAECRLGLGSEHRARHAPGAKSLGQQAPPQARGWFAGGLGARRRTAPDPSQQRMPDGRHWCRRRAAQAKLAPPGKAIARPRQAVVAQRPARSWSAPTGTCQGAAHLAHASRAHAGARRAGLARTVKQPSQPPARSRAGAARTTCGAESWAKLECRLSWLSGASLCASPCTADRSSFRLLKARSGRSL